MSAAHTNNKIGFTEPNTGGQFKGDQDSFKFSEEEAENDHNNQEVAISANTERKLKPAKLCQRQGEEEAGGSALPGSQPPKGRSRLSLAEWVKIGLMTGILVFLVILAFQDRGSKSPSQILFGSDSDQQDSKKTSTADDQVQKITKILQDENLKNPEKVAQISLLFKTETPGDGTSQDPDNSGASTQDLQQILTKIDSLEKRFKMASRPPNPPSQPSEATPQTSSQPSSQPSRPRTRESAKRPQDSRTRSKTSKPSF